MSTSLNRGVTPHPDDDVVGQVGEDDMWYLPKDNWSLIQEDGKVTGFMPGSSKVPGSFDIEESETGIRWRYSKANKFQVCEESVSDS